MYEIKKKCEEKFKRYLEEAIKLKEEGLVNEKIFRFNTICYILTDLLKDGILRSGVLTRLTKSILFSKTPDSVSSFLEKLNEKLKEEEVTKRYYFVVTSNVDIKSLKQKSYKINGIKTDLISSNDAEKQFRISSRFRDWHVFSAKAAREFWDFSYVIVEMEAGNPGSAFERAHSVFELFRGLINFACHFRTLSHTLYGGIPEVRTLSLLQPPKVMMLFNQKKEHLFDRFSIGFFDYSIKRFPSRRNDLLVELIDKINALKECSLKKRCFATFRKYNDGLDGNVAGTSFLEFWKIFELVALSDKVERGMTEAKVASRIASIFLKNGFSRDILSALCDKRNFIAHVGSLPDFDQDEINLIREYCEYAMMFLLNCVNIYEDEPTLECFYDNLARNETDLKRLEKVISEIRKTRK